MNKETLVGLLNEMLKSIGFSRKGNNWLCAGGEVIKMVNLQKSSYGNRFYINYGYIIKGLPLDGITMHVYHVLGAADKAGQMRLMDLLYFDSDIDPDTRVHELREKIEEGILAEMRLINTEVDLVEHLRARPHLNDILLTVKEYFSL